MSADGALKQKLETMVQINKHYANAYRERKVPQIYMAGGCGQSGVQNPDDEFTRFMNMINIKVAKDLALDMGIMDKK